MMDTEKEIAGFSFQKQIIGGLRKTDVTEYIEGLMSMVEKEREEIEKERTALYDIMKNGQEFCKKLAEESQKTADALIADAQQKADAILFEANEKVRVLQKEYGELIVNSQIHAEKLAEIVTCQQREVEESYALIFEPIKELLKTLEGDQDAF